MQEKAKLIGIGIAIGIALVLVGGEYFGSGLMHVGARLRNASAPVMEHEEQDKLYTQRFVEEPPPPKKRK